MANRRYVWTRWHNIEAPDDKDNPQPKIILRIIEALKWLADNAGGNMHTNVYDVNENGIVDNAEKVNNHSVYADVPTDAVFTDTVYDDAYLQDKVRYLEGLVDALANLIYAPEIDSIIDDTGDEMIDDEGDEIVYAIYHDRIAALRTDVDALMDENVLTWASAPANTAQEE